jgi:hypothetical protein
MVEIQYKQTLHYIYTREHDPLYKLNMGVDSFTRPACMKRTRNELNTDSSKFTKRHRHKRRELAAAVEIDAIAVL